MAFLKRARAFSLVVACAAAAIPLTAGAATPAASAALPAGIDAAALTDASVGPVVATGQLVDNAGHPAAGRVAALAWPSEQFQRTVKPGDQFTSPTVGSARAGADGVFTLRINPQLLPADYRSSTGQVNLNLVAWAGGSQGETNLSVQLGSPAGISSAAAKTATVTTAAPVHIKVNRPL